MKLSRFEKTLLTTVLVLTLALGYTGYMAFSQSPTKTLSLREQLNMGGVFHIQVWRFNGAQVLDEETHNLVTDIGEKHLRNLMASLNSTIINSDNRTVSLSLSNDGAPSASWTKLPNEITGSGLDRKGPTEVTITIVNATSYSTEYTWTATATVTVQTVGTHWYSLDGSDNNLYSAGNFTQTTLNNGDTIKITYTHQFLGA